MREPARCGERRPATAAYGLAFTGVPIAEQLAMSWDGLKQTDTGSETFRQNYHGPVPDHTTGQAAQSLPLS